MRFRTVSLAALVGAVMAPAVKAHMIMAQPVPYGIDTLNNSPLEGDYPCKQRAGVYDISKMNFIVSLDKQPTASSVFKVVHTIEGDCPGVNGGPDTFNFQLPQGFPNGEFALAWTWFNKIGNREMYMNCAPITVTGGADNKDVYNGLPDMQLANIPQTTCKTVDSTVPLLPNPGDSVDKRGDGPFQDMQGDCGAPTKTQPQMGGSSGNGHDSPSSDQPPVIPSSPPSPSPTSTSMPTPEPSTPVESAPAAAKPSTSAGGSSNAGCAEDGAMVCNGASQFGICSFGKVVWQDVAAGTKCEDGKITFAKKERRVVMRGVAGRVSYNFTLE